MVLSFLARHGFDAGTEILQHDGGCVTAGSAGHRSAGVSGGSGLIKPRDRHAMLRPSSHWTQSSGLRCIGGAGVIAATPVMRIHALQIHRTFHEARENFIFRQIGCEAAHVIKIRFRNFILQFVPLFVALFDIVGMKSQNAQGVHAQRARGSNLLCCSR